MNLLSLFTYFFMFLLLLRVNRCYVDGEIGPQLLGDVDREASLFASSSTQSSVQVTIIIRVTYMYFYLCGLPVYLYLLFVLYLLIISIIVVLSTTMLQNKFSSFTCFCSCVYCMYCVCGRATRRCFACSPFPLAAPSLR